MAEFGSWRVHVVRDHAAYASLIADARDALDVLAKQVASDPLSSSLSPNLVFLCNEILSETGNSHKQIDPKFSVDSN